MNDDSLVKIMQSLDLDYSKAIMSTLHFEKSIESLNKQLAGMKGIALQSAKDINTAFASQLGQVAGNKTIVDQFGRPFQTIESQAKNASTSIGAMANSYKNTTLAAQQHGNAVKGVADQYNIFANEWQRRSSWFLTGTMFYGVINGAREAASTIKQVEVGITDISRVMNDSTFVFDEYRDKLLQLGIDYGQTFDTVQDISMRWAQAGYNVADSLELTETALMALNAAELNAQTATQGLIAIMSQWGIEANELVNIIDKINVTSDNFAVTSQDLVDGLVRSSGAARNMNLSLEQTVALLTVMREASGRTGREVGNALNSILSYMQRTTAINTFERLGVQVFLDETRTQFRNVMDIMSDLSTNWDRASDEIKDGFVQAAEEAGLFGEEMAAALDMQEQWNDLQRRDVSQAAAGVFRRNYFIALIDNFANSQAVLNNMMDAEGYTMEKNAIAMETLEKKTQSFKASVEALAVAMGDAGLLDSFKNLVDAGTGFLNFITSLPKPTQDLILTFSNLVITVKAVELGLKTFGIASVGIGPSIAGLIKNTTSLTASISGAGTALTGFFAANWPILAIAGVTAAIVALRNEMKRAKEEADAFIETTKQNIENLNEEKQGLQELSREYDELKNRQQNLTATANEKERLIEIQRELVDLYGVSVTGIDAEGRAYADSTTAIQERIKALEELKAVEQENLETAVMARDATEVRTLEENVQKRIDLQDRLLAKQKEIDAYVSSFRNRDPILIESQYGSATLGSDHINYDSIGRSHIQSLNQEKLALQNALNDINTVIQEGTQNRQQLLREDAIKIVTQLGENGAVISDETRAYASELSKALSQTPIGILEARDELEKAINEFVSSDFAKLSEAYQRAVADGDTRAIDELATAIMELVRSFVQGNPALDNFALAMEGLYPNAEQLARALKGAANSTVDLKTSFQVMGAAVKDVSGDLKTLNQVISDVRRGQVLSADTILDLIEKYNLSADAIKQVKNGYTVEISALENLRDVKRQTAIEKINAEIADAKAVKEQTESRLRNYGIEIEQIKNLATAKAALAQQAVIEITGGRASSAAMDEIYSQVYAELSLAQKAMEDIEAAEKRAKLLTAVINDTSYGVSRTSSSNSSSRTENKALNEALKLLDHRKRISVETQDSIKREIEELNRINSLYVKTEDERMNMAERIYAAEKRLIDKRLQDSVNWINEKKSLDELSTEREIYLWEKVMRTQSNNIEAVKQATLNLHKLRQQLNQETTQREENSIQHLTKLGVYSIQQQIDKYRELYSFKASSIDEEMKQTEQLFGLYKNLLGEQQKTIKDAYDERLRQIEAEASRRKSAQEDVIRGIETELKLLDRQGQAYDHDQKMASLREELAYWQVRTSEEARKKVAELTEQIAEEERKREVELKKQTLEDKKQVAQDEIKAIDDAAKKERENWEKSYNLVMKAFDEHSTNIVARAAAMSKEAYQEWERNYLIPLQTALSSADFGSFNSIGSGFDSFFNDFSSSWDNFGKDWNVPSTTLHDWGMSEADYQRFKDNGRRWAELEAQGYKQATNAEMQRLNAENDALRIKYGRDPALGEKPKFHQGAKTLSYGIAEFMPGEYVFPPDLSKKMDGLLEFLKSNPVYQSNSNSATSYSTDKRVIIQGPLFNSERTVFEDDTDETGFARELQRAILALR